MTQQSLVSLITRTHNIHYYVYVENLGLLSLDTKLTGASVFTVKDSFDKSFIMLESFLGQAKEDARHVTLDCGHPRTHPKIQPGLKPEGDWFR